MPLSLPDAPLPPGKYRRLSRLADASGRFSMLAIDQRGSLAQMIARQTGADPATVGGDDLRRVKRAVTAALAPLASAVLTDPLFGYDASIDVVPPGKGILLAAEETGYEAAGAGERRSTLVPGFSVEQALRQGADAVKLLLWHHPDASPETQRHQQALVEGVGDACRRAEMPFVLEIVTYPAAGLAARSAADAADKPRRVVDAATVYSDPRFHVDLLKLEFPADLKYAEEYRDAPFHRGAVVFEAGAVADRCRQLDRACRVPWVILSAGVDAAEFVENVRLTNAAGASGFLCGRAVWKHVVDAFPDTARMRAHMDTEGRRRFEAIVAANREAVPWPAHPFFRQRLPHPARVPA